MNLWMQIALGAAIVMMLVFTFPAAKHWLQHGPKAKAGDWQAALIPLLAVVGFVILLIALAR